MDAGNNEVAVRKPRWRSVLDSADQSHRRFDFGAMLGRLVLRGWPWILLFWIVSTIAARSLAPSWESIAYDGDFEYLPAQLDSVAGHRLLEEAFPKELSRSQLLIVVSRNDGDQTPLQKADTYVALDIVRRLHHRVAEVQVQRALAAGWNPAERPQDELQKRHLDRALLALDEAIEADDKYYQYFAKRFDEVEGDAGEQDEIWPRLAVAYWDRAFLRQVTGDTQGADADQGAALALVPTIAEVVPAITDRDVRAWQSLLDVWTWNDPVIGHRLSPEHARLIVLRLSSELAAVSNVATLEAIEAMIADVRWRNQLFLEPGLKILPTGTAAIGAETLRSSADAIRYTEVFTVGLILVILAVIYRSPLLIAIPVISIGVAVVCATGLVAVIASLTQMPGLGWVDLKIFTTSRIFVVVILFGAGTDYCMFLISRLREEAPNLPWNDAVQHSLARVSDALIGSALTTVVGLAMLWFAYFGKFHYSGPVIAICLLVALAVCTTLTPALMIAFGPRVMWPTKIRPGRASIESKLWGAIGNSMTRRPLLVMTVGLLLLVPPAAYGVVEESQVTYDISSELGPKAISRQGIQLLRQNLPLGETNPVTMLVVRPHDVTREELEKDVKELAGKLYGVEGVSAVRYASDPLGDYPPDARMGLFDRRAIRRLTLQSHRLSKEYFWSDVDKYHNRLVRLDLVTSGDPFAAESVQDLARIRSTMVELTADPQSVWHDASFVFAGTIPSVADLRSVTIADAGRIKLAVVIAVLVILLLVLRRVELSVYMIVTVLITYFATLGMTVLFFRMAYGDTYVGLDWKVPIFLFVILVAIGQDYNVYLVTRILEEQQTSHPLAAIRRAVARTGGIITSCGVVMAGTFFSMTASAWVPAITAYFGMSGAEAVGTLRGITELGFALGFGVLLDTFYVRTVLVPAFCAFRAVPLPNKD